VPALVGPPGVAHQILLWPGLGGAKSLSGQFIGSDRTGLSSTRSWTRGQVASRRWRIGRSRTLPEVALGCSRSDVFGSGVAQ
jgi:hypothetical protein